MVLSDDFRPPEGLDWKYWVERWERMQARYLVRRAERLESLVRMLGNVVGPLSRIVDLGCGPGGLMQALLEAFPQAEVWGLDFDPTMLLLARGRLDRFGARAHLVEADLRESILSDLVPVPADAAVSATALHWLPPARLEALYGQIGSLLRPGGILLNADHVASDDPAIQRGWELHRERMRAQEGHGDADDWDAFWAAYAHALGSSADEVQERLSAGYKGGVEEGMPLVWHLDALRRCGFRSVDCYWRCDCDAIYGGIWE